MDEQEAKLSIKQAKILYFKSHLHLEDLSLQERTELGVTVFKLLTKWIPVLSLPIFTKKVYIEVIHDTITANKFDGEKTSQAFTELEKYFKLIYNHPWKKEFKILKLYSGFFNSKIKSQLSNPEKIFALVGYQQVNESEMVLNIKPNRDSIIDVCFECLQCAVICKTIELNYNEIKDMGGSLMDAFEWRKTGNKPNEKYLAEKLLQEKREQEKLHVNSHFNYNGNKTSQASPKMPPKSNYLMSGVTSNNNGTSYYNDHHYAASDIPFIDEGTQDDHIDASFREVNLKQQKQQSSLPKSQEWDFIKQKPNSEYKDGYRGHSEVISKSSRVIKPEGSRLFDNRRYGTTVVSKGKKESSEIFYPPVSVNTMPNISEHKRSGHMVYPRVSGNEIADSCRDQMKTKQTYGSNALDTDGDCSFSSTHFELPDNADLYLARSTNSSPSCLDVWCCDYCTTVNDSVKFVCSGCCKSRNPGPDLDSPRAGDRKKVCSTCTLENNPSEKFCTACDQPLKPSNVQTYV